MKGRLAAGLTFRQRAELWTPAPVEAAKPLGHAALERRASAAVLLHAPRRPHHQPDDHPHPRACRRADLGAVGGAPARHRTPEGALRGSSEHEVEAGEPAGEGLLAPDTHDEALSGTPRIGHDGGSDPPGLPGPDP